MFTKSKAAVVSIVMAAASVAFIGATTVHADAAGKYYSSCDALHRDFKHGVAKSKAAAAHSVRDGYGRPATGKRAKAVYYTNASRLDRDKDGVACEA